jgi:hypothetical protein
MLSEIKLVSYQTSSQYQNLELFNSEAFLERICEGDHQGVLDWLDLGGTLDDRLDHRCSIAYYCFDNLSTVQLKEILSRIPPETSLPEDALDFIVDDWKGTGIEKIIVLLPDLEKFNYSFDWIYTRVIEDGKLDWIDFFLTHSPQNLDLNLCFYERGFEFHPLTQMKFLATRWSIQAKIADRISLKQQPMLAQLDQIHAIIERMENDSRIDVGIALEQLEELKKYYYFEGDPQYEKDCAFIVDAMTLEGLEKHVAAGFDLYAPIGPFSIVAEIDGDGKWIELLTFFFEYPETQLIELMEKYRNHSTN